jgi:rhodanese-related sulfurtransferase
VTAAGLVGKPGVHLVDVRTEAEFAFVGHPVGAVNVPLMRFDPKTYGMAPNPKFLEEIRARFSPDDTLLMICRSGSRSGKAAKLLAEAGYRKSFNVMEGVEGDPDADGHRTVNGWKVRGLPYEYAVDPAKVTPPNP